jgi:large subunit ribosomal protein L11
MGKETVDVLVDGGKATAGPALGSALGPLRVNIGQVVAKINELTKPFAGMKVPAKVIVDTETKAFEVTIGTPPASDLIKKEIGLAKGTGDHAVYNAGVIAFEQLIKVAKMKESSLIINSLKSGVKTMIGSCITLGLLVDGKNPRQVLQEVDEGKYDELLKNETTEVPEEKKKLLEPIKAELADKKDLFMKEKAAKKASDEAKQAKKAAKVQAQVAKK